MRKLLILSVVTVVVATAIARQPAASSTQTLTRAAYAPGQVIVKLRQGASYRESLNEVARSQGEGFAGVTDETAEPLGRVRGNARISRIASDHGLDRTFVLRFDERQDVEEVIGRLRSNDAVEHAEPNYYIKPGSSIPDDPKFSDQWGLRNLGLSVLGYPAKLDADIKAIDAWDITTGSPDVIVALTDTGVDIDHPDLAPNIYQNPREIPGNGVDDDNNGYIDDVNGYNVADRNGDVSDVIGHGTQMAGIIAARTNNAAGISGVSQSRILPVRFFTRTGPDPIDVNATVADAARALLYSIAAGANIINASWRTLLDVPESEAVALSDAVNATNDAGVLLVCIAGNEGYNNDHTRVYPGSYQLDNQIVVGASEFNDEIWHPPFEPSIIKSGYGRSSVHLMAPGVSVLTTLARGSCVTCSTSSDAEDWYGYVDGTSAAAAFVSGVAALVKSRYPDAYVTVVKRRILDGVDVRQELEPFVMTSGRLNAYGALTAAPTIAPPVLERIKYKAGNQKLLLYGNNIQRGAIALIGGLRYKVKLKGGEPPTGVAKKVPDSALPVGIPVSISIVNPDGGQSDILTFTR